MTKLTPETKAIKMREAFSQTASKFMRDRRHTDADAVLKALRLLDGGEKDRASNETLSEIFDRLQEQTQ